MSAARILKNPLVWAVAFGLVLTGYTASVAIERRASGIPQLGAVPQFTLTSQEAQRYGRDQLDGKVWIANFIFTRCPTICPMFTARMREVQRRAPKDFQLVSFSVDPGFDTPERLKSYAEKHRADLSNWAFLTGDLAAIKAAVTEGLKVGFGTNPKSEGIDSIFHGTHFVLVDATGNIRGYYEMNEPGAVDRLIRDAKRIAP